MNKPFELLLWQKRQAAIIYHFTTLDYLRGSLKIPHLTAIFDGKQWH